MAKIKIEIDMPENCGECPFYRIVDYSCHNESGQESKCSMGYMRGDFRDRIFYDRRYAKCKLEGLQKVEVE